MLGGSVERLHVKWPTKSHQLSLIRGTGCLLIKRIQERKTHMDADVTKPSKEKINERRSYIRKAS